MPDVETIFGFAAILFVVLFFGWLLWLTNPKHDERLQKFVGWLWESNHPKNKKPKKY